MSNGAPHALCAAPPACRASLDQTPSSSAGWVQALLWETSLLDAEEGIRFRGYSIPELQASVCNKDVSYS